MFDDFYQVEAFFEQRKQYGVKPGLDRIHKLLYLLDNPQYQLKAVHTAGTNGKGSTIHYLKRALVSNGYRVGIFHSPSLEGLTGHILINDARMTETVLIDYVNRIYPFVSQLDAEHNHPSEFEIITAVALLYFAGNTDIALIEAGMGGREDTTNCLSPVLTIITNVAQDHTYFLGGSTASIADHKAGIIQDSTPVIAGEMDQSAMSVIAGEALSKNAPIYWAGRDFGYKAADATALQQPFQWVSASGCSLNITLQTPGIYQIKNASLALMALVILETAGVVGLNWTDCRKGLAAARLHGRFEVIHRHPAIILDGAHNPAGVQAFTDTLTACCADMNKHLIFAAFKDKDLTEMLRYLEPHFSAVTVTTFDHPRAASIKQLQEASSTGNILCQSDWRQAIRQIDRYRDNDGYFITGSLHFIGVARKYFEELGIL